MRLFQKSILVLLILQALSCSAMCLEIKKTRSATSSKYHNYHRMAEERLWREQVSWKAIRSFQDAYRLAQQNRSLMQSYLTQTLRFVNLVAFAPGTNHISDHLACFDEPEDCTDVEKINTPLLDPIRQTQMMLAMIIFNRDGTYKGFTSSLDYKLWASTVTDYLRNYFHYNDSESFLKSMLILKNRSVPGFTDTYDHLEESSEYKAQREAFRIKAKYAFQFTPNRIKHPFNINLKSSQIAFRDQKFDEAEKILLSYTEQMEKSRHPDKQLRNHMSDVLYELLQMDQTVNRMQKFLSKFELKKLEYFEARQKKILLEARDAIGKAYIACETAFALEWFIADEIDLVSKLRDSRRVETGPGAIYLLTRVNSIDSLIEFFDTRFRLSQTAVNEALVLIESHVLTLYPNSLPELIEHLKNNLESLETFLNEIAKEYGSKQHIFKIAHYKSLYMQTTESSTDKLCSIFIKRIADHITLKIIEKTCRIDKIIRKHQPKPQYASNNPTNSVDFSNVNQITQLMKDVTSNNEALFAYIDSEINSEELTNAQIVLISELNKLGTIINRTSEQSHDILAEEISTRILQLHNDTKILQQDLASASIVNNEYDEKRLLELLEQNKIQEAECYISQEGQHALIQSYLENVSNIELFLFSALKKGEDLNLIEHAKKITELLNETLIDQDRIEAIKLRLNSSSLEYDCSEVVSQKGIDTVYQYLADILIIKTLAAIIAQACAPRAASSSSTN